ncbi:sensor histidine kinase [Paenibacillus oenotherae]|uniref:histidine kinase n=1 Tax=Paenibacillus oenotherae TaxID=1435645 RepID=A0ABS7D879_9BACL|nr:ATP-binding protein [Paenibacillus oenotherae]MBW7476019.1 sensor histidine kinase [Paenibacillus oenotherae]
MTFSKIFLVNISLLITLAYLFNLGYKYIFQHTSIKVKYGITIAIFILGGWLAMVFGLRIHDTLVDLRFVPLIVAVLVLPNPSAVAIIGFGIGAGRLFFGLDSMGWAGFVSMIVLGLVGAAMNYGLQRVSWKSVWKSTAAVIGLNIVFALNATLVYDITNNMDCWEYWYNIGIVAFPLRLILSGLFVFIIKDFRMEQQRVDDLRMMNMLLRRQTRALREAKQEVEDQAHELLQASKYKSEFLANMSHELKTPLNSIILLSQLIRDNDEDSYESEVIRYGDLIHAAGNDLLQLINDILDLSKVEAGKMDVVFEPVSTYDLVHMLHQQFQPVADQKKLDFEMKVAENVPGTIRTDALRVNQILRNLIVNAFKFTEQGSVKLHVGYEGGSAAIESGPQSSRRIRNWNPASWGRPAIRPLVPPRVVFSVADTGIGIDPDKQQLIFEAFRQEDGAINRKYGGTGLGLSISLQLSRLLGGSLKLQSSKGEGSTFMLYLPVRPAAAETEELELPQPPADGVKPRRRALICKPK